MVYLSCAWSVRTQQATYVCQAQGGCAHPQGPVGAARTQEETFHFGIFKIRRSEASSSIGRWPCEGACLLDAVYIVVAMYPPAAQRAIYNNVKLRPGRIHRPPDVAEHQLRGRWHQQSSSFYTHNSIIFFWAKSKSLGGFFFFSIFQFFFLATCMYVCCCI